VALKAKVVEEEDEENIENEILLPDAVEYDPDIKIGETLVHNIPLESFGRNIIQLTKQNITSKVREAERDRIFADYKERMGDLITGSVQQVDRGTILVNLGRAEAILPMREQIRSERYRQGDTIRAYIVDVQNTPNTTQIILSRTHPQFLIRLFELEVPEIYDKIVEIRGVARDPGRRSKITVYSKDSRIDPVGACVGMKGNRVQAIVRELNNERIDIVNWIDDLDTFVRRTFNPLEIKKVITVGKARLVLHVEDKDLSLAIGRGGQNIKLSAQLIGRELDIFGVEQWAGMSEEEKSKALDGKDDENPFAPKPAAKNDETEKEESPKETFESAAMTNTTTSVAFVPRIRMAVKASWPGVSRKVTAPVGVSTS